MDEPESYCGASNGQLICRKYALNEEPLKAFEEDTVYEDVSWLDLEKCEGSLHPTTFSLLPNLELINIADCNFEGYSPGVFGALQKLSSLSIYDTKFSFEGDLFEDSKDINSVSISGLECINDNIFIHLNKLESLAIGNCKFENLSKQFFAGLNFLKCLCISYCEIESMEFDVFDELESLEELKITDNTIGNIDFNVFSNLVHLKHISLQYNKINSDADYEVLKKLPALESVLLDASVLVQMDFDEFPKLKKVEIGIESGIPDYDFLTEKLKSKGIKYEFVICDRVFEEVPDDMGGDC